MTTNNQIYGQLGGLEATVKEIKESLHAMRAKQDIDAERADRARSVLHTKVDDLRYDLHALDKRVATEMLELREVVADVDAKASSAKEAADDYRRVVQQGKGALFIVGIGGTSFGAAVIYFFDHVIEWLRLRMGL